MSNDYEVGKYKPPVHSRFQKGRSGNPRGRPKGSMTFAGIIKKVLRTKVNLIKGDKRTRVPLIEAVATNLSVRAAKGDVKATRELLFWAEKLGLLTDVDESDPNARTGVLVVPATLSPEEWIAMFGNRYPGLKAPAKSTEIDQGPRFLKPGKKP